MTENNDTGRKQMHHIKFPSNREPNCHECDRAISGDINISDHCLCMKCYKWFCSVECLKSHIIKSITEGTQNSEVEKA